MKQFIVTVQVSAKVDITLSAENKEEAERIVKERKLYWNDEHPDDKYEYFPRIGGGGNEVEYDEDDIKIISIS